MKYHIYAVRPPDGRCALLAHKLYHTTLLSAQESLRLAEMLYFFNVRADTPETIEVIDKAGVPALQDICSTMGIVVEPIEDKA